MLKCKCTLDGWIDGWMGRWMDRWMDGWVDGSVGFQVRLVRFQVLFLFQFEFQFELQFSSGQCGFGVPVFLLFCFVVGFGVISLCSFVSLLFFFFFFCLAFGFRLCTSPKVACVWFGRWLHCQYSKPKPRAETKATCNHQSIHKSMPKTKGTSQFQCQNQNQSQFQNQT